jgi:hypothetical protein
MNDQELNAALQARELAARNVQAAANGLSDALAAFGTATDAVLVAIPRIALNVGDRAQAKHKAGWYGEPSSSDAETAGRLHASRAAGAGAAAAIEHRLCQAFSNGLARDSVAQTVGYEFSTEAGPILRAAGEVAAQRAPQSPPDRRFVSIIRAQHQRLRLIVEQQKE